VEEVHDASGVARWAAKRLFLILIFGGTISTWRIEHNVPGDTALPHICGEMFRGIAGLKADFKPVWKTMYLYRRRRTRKLNTNYNYFFCLVVSRFGG
jgi:hypothetical protein